MNYELLAWCCRAGTPDLLISLTFKQDFVTLQTRLLLSSNKTSFKSKEALFFTRTFGNFGMTHNQLICSLLASVTLDLLITDVDKQSTPHLHPIYIQSTPSSNNTQSRSYADFCPQKCRMTVFLEKIKKQ